MRITSKVASFLLIAIVISALLCLASGQETTRRPRRGRNRNNANRSRQNRQNGTGGNRRRGPERYGCEEIFLPMCKGLISYTHTKLPNQFNHTTQQEVYRHLVNLWPYMDHSCSTNIRQMTCAKYLPQCHGRRQGKGPCKKTCLVAKKKCARTLRTELGLAWAETFACAGLPSRRCVRPMRDRRCPNEHPVCVENQQIPVCANLTFTWGTLPNMFGQCHIQQINTEISLYESLIASNCHLDLKFLLCGIFSPFCVRNEVPFTFPCQEICEEIREACEPHYRRLNHNLPWPSKLQCHRYPRSDNTDYQCVMPNEGRTFNGGK